MRTVKLTVTKEAMQKFWDSPKGREVARAMRELDNSPCSRCGLSNKDLRERKKRIGEIKIVNL